MPVAVLPVTYEPVTNGVSPGARYPFSIRYSWATRSLHASPMDPPWNPLMPVSGPAIIRLVIACVYSCPITVMS